MSAGASEKATKKAAKKIEGLEAFLWSDVLVCSLVDPEQISKVEGVTGTVGTTVNTQVALS
jgi:hypothetical protein